MGVFVVGCYRPKPGREADLDRVADHLPVLRAAGLAPALPGTTERWPAYGLVQWPGE
jgi:hypothetical protein